MARYLALVEDRLKKLGEWMVRRIPWTKNLKADALAEITTTLPIREVVMLPIYLQAIPSIMPEPVCSATEADLCWMHDIVKYLQSGELLEDEKYVYKVHIQAACFTLIKTTFINDLFKGYT